MAKPSLVAANLLVLFIVVWIQFFVLSNPSQCIRQYEFIENPASFFACNYWDGVQWGIYVFAAAAIIGLIISLMTSDEKNLKQHIKEEKHVREEKIIRSEEEDAMRRIGLVPLRCMRCGTGNSPAARFCSRCGARL